MGLQVLIVEDDTGIREALAECVATLGVEVSTARDGEEALERLRKGFRPDAAVVDLRLPGLDGNGLVAAMRADEALAGIPTITMTASGDRPRHPVCAHLRKPFDLDELGKVLGRLLETAAA